MNRLKSKKGITLIALIITIIILLILAMVTIRILMNQGIIRHTQNATTAYNEAQNNELEYLTYTEGEMDKYAGGENGVETAIPVPDELEEYVMGEGKTGRKLTEIFEWRNKKFINDSNTISNASNEIKLLKELYDGNEETRIIEYKGEIYDLVSVYKEDENNQGYQETYSIKRGDTPIILSNTQAVEMYVFEPRLKVSYNSKIQPWDGIKVTVRQDDEERSLLSTEESDDIVTLEFSGKPCDSIGSYSYQIVITGTKNGAKKEKIFTIGCGTIVH